MIDGQFRTVHRWLRDMYRETPSFRMDDSPENGEIYDTRLAQIADVAAALAGYPVKPIGKAPEIHIDLGTGYRTAMVYYSPPQPLRFIRIESHIDETALGRAFTELFNQAINRDDQ